MTIFVVIRKRDNKVVGAYADTRAIFSLPSDVYTVCVAERDKMTRCQDIDLTKDTSITLKHSELQLPIPYVELKPSLAPLIEAGSPPTIALNPKIPATIEINIESQTQQ